VPCFNEFYGTVADLVARCCPSAPRILDLGAGTGILSAAIVDRVPGGRLTLLDASAEMLQRAATRLARFHQPKFLVQQLTAELPAGPFDAVVSALAIHHLSHPEKSALLCKDFEYFISWGHFSKCRASVRQKHPPSKTFLKQRISTLRVGSGVLTQRLPVLSSA